MSDVKPHMNANTSVLEYLVDNTQHLMSFSCLNVSFWAKNFFEMSQNGKLLILTTNIN